MAFRFLLNRNNVEENVPPGELLLDIIRQNRGLTGTKEVVAITGTTRPTATRDLQDLVMKGALTRTGERKQTRYCLKS